MRSAAARSSGCASSSKRACTDAARDEIARLDRKARGLDDRLTLAQLHAELGAFNRAQRLVVDGYGLGLSRGPVPGQLELWWHAWPAPFEREVREIREAGVELDTALLYSIMREESGYRPEVVSVSGARGLLQLMPTTAERVAREVHLEAFSVDDLFLPGVNIHLGSAYLEGLLRQFDGRQSAAIGSYNAGPHVVSRWVDRHVGEDDEFVEEIPYSQTRAYVKAGDAQPARVPGALLSGAQPGRSAPLLPPRKGSHDVDLRGLGQVSLDRVGVVEQLPEPGGKAALLAEHELPGGQVATALLAAAGLGLRTALHAAVGDDEEGRRALAPLARAGVDLAGVHTLPGVPSRCAWVLVERARAERRVLEQRDPALVLPAERSPDTELAGTRLVLLDLEHPAAARATAERAAAAGVPVLLDADRATPEALEIARMVDFPIVSEGFADTSSSGGSHEEVLRALSGPKTRMAVVTRGARGSLALCDGRFLETPAPVAQVVDTTGAGDVFRGAFAWALLQGESAEGVLIAANAQASASCAGLGAQGALPDARGVT